MFEIQGAEINFSRNREPGFLPEELLADVAAAGGSKWPVLMGSPVHVIKIEAIQVEVVQILDEVLCQPLTVRRVEAEPAQIFRLWLAVIQKLHQPLWVNFFERLGVVHRIVGKN